MHEKWAWFSGSGRGFKKFRAHFARIWSNRTPLMVILDLPLHSHQFLNAYQTKLLRDVAYSTVTPAQ